jgi:hypothetical protein
MGTGRTTALWPPKDRGQYSVISEQITELTKILKNDAGRSGGSLKTAHRDDKDYNSRVEITFFFPDGKKRT